MKKLKHIQLIALLAFSFIFQLAAAQDTTQQITPGRFNSATAQKKPYVILISIDGLRSDFVEKYHAHLLAGGEVWPDVPASLRRITVEEAASIQSFPIGMKWAGPVSARFRQIGNAVPPRLAYHVALSVLKSLSELPAGNLPIVPDYSLEELKLQTEKSLLLL